MAGSIPEETIRRIVNATNIVDIIGERVVLKKAGRNFVGLCPFHTEKTPSFSVSPDKQIFYCFGCHTGGDVLTFIRKQEGLSFSEAVGFLAGKVGIELPQERLTPDQKKRLSEKEALFEINESALRFFRNALYDPQQGQKALAYVLGRGMTRKIMDSHMLGYAPPRWDGLLRFFQNRKTSEHLLVKAGLIIPRKEGNGFYDRFRDRIMFPIFNMSQQVIGFGGRVMGDELPKYLNSPETPVFNKRGSLYGLNKARAAARSKGKIYVVEGYFDVLAMHLYGLENTVASLGTALTGEHVQMLRGLVGQTGQVVLVYDSDQAGIKAAQRSVSIFEQGFVDARILILPKDYDPDLFLREHGPDEFQRLSQGAMGMIPFLIESAIAEHGSSIEGKVKVVAALQDSLAAVQDSVARTLYIQQLSERLRIAESVILEKVRQTVAGKAVRVNPEQGVKSLAVNGRGAGDRLEHQIVAMMLRFPSIISEVVGRNIMDAFENERLKEIALTLSRNSSDERKSISDLVAGIEDQTCRNMLTQLLISDSQWDREGCERVLAQFEARCHRRHAENLQRQIEAAEKKKDFELLGKLLRQKQQQAGKGLTHL